MAPIDIVIDIIDRHIRDKKAELDPTPLELAEGMDLPSEQEFATNDAYCKGLQDLKVELQGIKKLFN